MKQNDLQRIAILFRSFLKFGCFTFGGGWSIIAQIQKEFVEKRKWITDEELLDYTSLGRSFPGLMIGNISILFGYQTAGILGAFASLLGMVLPPIGIMMGVVLLYDHIKDNLYVARAMTGVRAAVVPIIFQALIKLFRSGMKDAFCYVMAAAALALCLFTPVNSVMIVLMGAAAGLLYQEGRRRHDLC